MISIKNINKSFFLGEEEIKAINNVSLNVEKGEYISIVGPSGSGKSTLMNVLGLLDTPDSGEYILDNVDVSRISDDVLSVIRNKKIGFIFQNFNLLNKLTALENVMVPLIYNGYTEEDAKKRAHEVLCMVGLEERENHTPNKLSGGQSQRVARDLHEFKMLDKDDILVSQLIKDGDGYQILPVQDDEWEFIEKNIN